MVAVPLIYGRLTALDYEDNIANNPLIDELRTKMVCSEDNGFSDDYLDPDKRSIANGISIDFIDGSKTDEIVIEYPVGHKRRREEGIPLLLEKFRINLARRYTANQQHKILETTANLTAFNKLPVSHFINMLCEGLK